LNETTDLRLLLPRLVRLSPELEREAVALFAELLLDVARKRRGGVLGGAFDGGCGGVIGGVALLPAKAGKARKAA